MPDDAAEQLAHRRYGNHAQIGATVPHQADIHRKLVVAGRELPGSIQRVHQPVLRCRCGDTAGGNFFLGNHRHIGAGMAQALHDDRLSLMIRLRHRRFILLALHVEATRAHGQDRFAGLEGKASGEGEQ